MRQCYSVTRSQLFGEADADQDVSPDKDDPELQGSTKEDGGIAMDVNQEDSKMSTRQWAESIHYAPEQLFMKFFFEDVKYLLKLDKLWQKRAPPTPVHIDHLPSQQTASDTPQPAGLQDQRLWSLKECVLVFVRR